MNELKIKTLSYALGWQWITTAYDVFKKSPMHWILMTGLWLIMILVINKLPLGSILFQLSGPLFLMGFMKSCHRVTQDQAIKIEDLFVGFSEKTKPILILGGISLLGGAIITALCGLLMIGSIGYAAVATLFFDSSSQLAPSLLTLMSMSAMGGLLFVALVFLTLITVLTMAVLFSPALILFHDIEPVEAMKLSFRACMANMSALTWYSVILSVLGLIALIPLGLGFLILGPVIIISIYTAYRDIFVREEIIS